MNRRKMAKWDKQAPRVAVAALNAAQRRAMASGQPLVLVIGDGLYRISGTGDRELIRQLPPRVVFSTRRVESDA